MRVDLRCKVCQAKLAVKSELAGKTVRCPKCANPVRVIVTPVVLPQIGNKAATPMMAVQVSEEPMWAEVLPEGNADFEVLPDEAPMEAVPMPPPPRPKPSRPALPQQAETAVAEQETTEDSPRPRMKKKKKSGSKLAKKEAASIPMWIWVVGGIGSLVTLGGIIVGFILMMRMGTPDGEDIEWRYFAFRFMINVPATLVILVLSMFLSSALGGGINFGDAKTAILGAIFLIVIVNIVALIPVAGIYLTLIVWLVGFMTIFGLDPWEARFLLIINFILNYTINMALIHYMLSHPESNEVDPEEDRPARTRKREPERKKNNQQRGFPKSDEDDGEQGYLLPERMHDRVAIWVASQDRRNTLLHCPG